MLEHKLDAEHIQYEKIDNMDEILSTAGKYGLMEAPFIIYNDKVYNFIDALHNLETFKE